MRGGSARKNVSCSIDVVASSCSTISSTSAAGSVVALRALTSTHSIRIVRAVVRTTRTSHRRVAADVARAPKTSWWASTGTTNAPSSAPRLRRYATTAARLTASVASVV